MKEKNKNKGYYTELVKDNEMFLFEDMFPKNLMRGNILVLGAYNSKDMPVGASLIGVEEDNIWRLVFVYVNKEDRGNGVLSLMLDHIEAAATADNAVISVEYELQADHGLQFDYIFNKRGYKMSESSVSRWLVTREMLLASPLAGESDKESKFQSNIVSLNGVTNVQIDKMLEEADATGRTVSKEEVDEAAIWLSRAYLVGNEIKGLLLMEPTREPGLYALTLIYISQSHVTLAPLFFKNAMKSILSENKEVKNVIFSCQDSEINMLAKKMIGDDRYTKEHVVVSAIRVA